MNLFKTITPLHKRVIVFLVFFVVISGAIGPRIISGDILERDGFEIYGSIGKATIFALISFVLLARHKKEKLSLEPWQPTLLTWTLAGFLAFILAWMNVDALLAGNREFMNLFLAHAGIWLCLIFAAIGCFGIKNITLLWRTYQREVMYSIAFAIVFYFFLLFIYSLWQPLAAVVMVSVSWLLEISGLVTAVIPPNVLVLDKFGITIAEYCSGIESIALFTSLYAVVGLLEWKQLNKKRYFIVFPFALLFLFVFNILRVYGLILAGYYINLEIAFSLFHTYAGMVFFIVYSALFWAIAYKYLVHRQTKS